jgi:hypothetical protein
VSNSGSRGALTREQYEWAMQILGQTTEGPRPGNPPAGRDEGGKGDGASTRRT